MSNAQEMMAKVITEKLLEMMGDGSDAALQLWRKTLSKFAASGLPYNADTGRPYNGGNIMQLFITANARGFESNGWVTMGNMIKRGWKIKKGCKAPWQWVLSPRMALTRKDAKGNPILNKDGEASKFMGPQRAYKVFNMDCVDTGATRIPAQRKVTTLEHDYEAMRVLCDLHEVKLTHRGNEAYYRPSEDAIYLPPQSAFKDEQAYYHVLAHELTHWTGHKSRLDREMKGGFGSADYAFEELIAELGSAFLMASLGMGDSQHPSHANYLKSWIKALKEDTSFVMKASSKASQACTFLLAPLQSSDAPQDAEEVEDDVPAAEAPDFTTVKSMTERGIIAAY